MFVSLSANLLRSRQSFGMSDAKNTFETGDNVLVAFSLAHFHIPARTKEKNTYTRRQVSLVSHSSIKTYRINIFKESIMWNEKRANSLKMQWPLIRRLSEHHFDVEWKFFLFCFVFKTKSCLFFAEIGDWMQTIAIMVTRHSAQKCLD